jgi:RNA polymerase-binding transcription factor DksA
VTLTRPPWEDGDVEDVAAAEAELDAVEHALERLDDGSYGACEVCGTRLDDAQLAGDPTARHCPAHLPGIPS